MDQTKFEIVGIKLGSQGLDVFKWKQKEVPSLSLRNEASSRPEARGDDGARNAA